MMQSIPFAGGTLHDPQQDFRCHDVAVLPEESVINEASDWPRRAQSTPRISLRGRTLTPGPIDARRHCVLSGVRLHRLGEMPLTPFATGGSVAMQAITRASCFVRHAH